MYQDNVLFSERKWGDPVRVKASFSSHSKRVDGHVVPEYRRFSVDPQLTNYEILRSLLSRAFDIQSDFLIQYRFEDTTGQEIFLHLISDWDLEAAFDRAADPYLCLRIDPIPIEQTVEEWDLINIPTGEFRGLQSKEIKNDPSIQTKILTKVEKTINMMQQALHLNGSNVLEFAAGISTTPLTDSEFTDYRDGVGTLVKVEKLRQRIFQGGLEPSLRRVVWKHLLNVYPDGLNGSERMKYIGNKSDEYRRLKNEWMSHYLNKKMTEELMNVTSMVRKDVLRTDRQHPFYAGGDDNPNVELLFNILTTYAIYHPSVGYCQGMSDMASPILFVMGNESHAYIAFTALMERLKDNFTTTGATMTLKFEHLASALAYHDPVFFAYLNRHHAMDLLFCYRWLLLEMKREFAFDDALRMMEVMWSSLPLKLRQEELALFEKIPEFNPVTKPIPLPRCKESPYTKVCALRRQGSSSGSPSALCDPTGSPLRKAFQRRSYSASSWERKGDSDSNFIYHRSKPIDGSHQFSSDTKVILESTSTVIRPKIGFKAMTVSDDFMFSSDGGIAVFNESTENQDEEVFESYPTLPNNSIISPAIIAERVASSDLDSDETSPLIQDKAQRSNLSSTIRAENGKPVDRRPEGETEDAAPDSLQDYEVVGSCEEAVEAASKNPAVNHPGFMSATSLPPPDILGSGNPFLIFLCIAVMLQHRDVVINRSLDSNELAMHFDRMVRKHNVERVLSQARTLYYKYLGHFKKEISSRSSSPKRNLGV